MKKYPCEFHSSLRHLMRLCRWDGFFPVEGLNDSTPGRIRFKFKSVYSVYYAASVVCLGITTCSTFHGLFARNLALNTMTNFFFCLTAFVTVLLLLRLAINWPTLIKTALDTERELRGIRKSKKIPTICTVLSYAVMSLALVEHILCNMFYLKLVNCSGNTVLDFDVIEKFFRHRLSYVFDHIPYSIWVGLIAEFCCMQATFMWSFTDVMVMCVSVYLSTYFQDLGKAMNSKEPRDWAQLRRYYSRLVFLLNQINSQLGGLILISAFCNLCFICLQLFNSLHDGHVSGNNICDSEANKIERKIPMDYMVYYLFSFTFLLSRALLMSYLAANVHRSANCNIMVLYEVPASEYNVEVQRFQLQVRYTKVGLSGIFFHIERTLILRVIGTIITYELVMLQFSHQEDMAELSRQNFSKVMN